MLKVKKRDKEQTNNKKREETKWNWMKWTKKEWKNSKGER